MGGSSFELLIQEIFNQKQRMDELLEENHTLRCQLADLRAGRGILLEICGQQFTLNTEVVPASTQVASPIQDSAIVEQATMSMPVNEPAISTLPIDQATIRMPVHETPHPNTDQIEHLPDSLAQVEQETSTLPTSSFLEEMLIDEFAAASTTQIPSWQGSQTRKLPVTDEIDEDEKAVLRRQLIGSFLLE